MITIGSDEGGVAGMTTKKNIRHFTRAPANAMLGRHAIHFFKHAIAHRRFVSPQHDAGHSAVFCRLIPPCSCCSQFIKFV